MNHTTPEFEQHETTNSNNFWQRQKILIKGLLIGFLVLMLLIPTFFISSLVQERANRSKDVKDEIAAQWGNEQEIRGPIITIPYYEYIKDSKKKISKVKSYAYFLPNKLDISGSLVPEIKYRSIFEMVVYTANLQLKGNFKKLDFTSLKIPMENLILNEAQVLFGIADFKGIKEEMVLNLKDQSLVLAAGMPDNQIFEKGLSAPIKLSASDLDGTNNFSMSLKLRGAEGIYFLPFGKSTQVNIKADWANPAFHGSSPDRNITDSSFSAQWNMFSINREYPQQWTDNNRFDLDTSAFGVDLLQPVNHYSKNERSVKYGILIILLTFVVYFFIEILQKKNAHAIQYVLVGFALCIFYTLLLSFSELVGFNWAYLISAGATVSLLGVYTKSVFQSTKSGLIFSSFLSGLYVFIFSLIQLQDRALLFGSVGLFIILALVMYVSRKINWYNK